MEPIYLIKAISKVDTASRYFQIGKEYDYNEIEDIKNNLETLDKKLSEIEIEFKWYLRNPNEAWDYIIFYAKEMQELFDKMAFFIATTTRNDTRDIGKVFERVESNNQYETESVSTDIVTLACLFFTKLAKMQEKLMQYLFRFLEKNPGHKFGYDLKSKSDHPFYLEYKTTIVLPQSSTNYKSRVESHLKPLSGKFKGNEILSKDDYLKLLNNVLQLVTTSKLPASIKPINLLRKIPQKIIRGCFIELYLEFQGTVKKKLWVELIKKTFAPMFDAWEYNTLHSRFVQNEGYKQDIENYITY